MTAVDDDSRTWPQSWRRHIYIQDLKGKWFDELFLTFESDIGHDLRVVGMWSEFCRGLFRVAVLFECLLQLHLLRTSEIKLCRKGIRKT